MLLKKIRYSNFRPFIGQQEIDFMADSDKDDANVTVILGENTFGKSEFI